MAGPNFGSSPLARGTRHSAICGEEKHRFIPAGAGNTATVPALLVITPVHPRWRGEHSTKTRAMSYACGSSPLARGTRLSYPAAAAWGRFIPAGAGNTVPRPAPCRTPAVHPRWRGEHPGKTPAMLNSRGSSPLARGTLGGCRSHSTRRRFIPAGAGNTPTAPPPGWSKPVHPRWRGEH